MMSIPDVKIAQLADFVDVLVEGQMRMKNNVESLYLATRRYRVSCNGDSKMC